MSSPLGRRISIHASMMLLALAVFGVFLNAIPNGYVWDDEVQILNNPWIKNIEHLGKMFSSDVFGHFQAVEATNYYRPIAHALYTITWHLFGASASAFHAVNVLLHLGVTLLVFRVTLDLLSRLRIGKNGRGRLGRRRADPDRESVIAAFVAALFFGVHPVHSEAVDWISGIMEPAFTLFGLMSFRFFLDRAGKGGGRRLALSVALFAMALLSKETAIIVLPLLLLHDLSLGGEDWSTPAPCWKYLPYLAAVAIYFALRTHALGRFVPIDMHPDLSTYECIINIFPLFVQHL